MIAPIVEEKDRFIQE
jgi:chromosome segregation ATPase